MRRIAVLDAPSNLGLRPPTPTSVPGCAKAPGALRDHGLLRRLNARDAGCLTPPRYDPGDWRPGDGVCHAPEIGSYSRRLADRIGAIIDQGEFPVVLGGDCSIVLGSALAMHRLGEAVGGRIGLVFVDGHSDFRHPGNASYVGAAAGEDLALVTGRGQHDLAAMEGRRPYYRDIDVVVMGIRAQDEYRLDLQAAGIVTRPVPTLRVEGAARSAQWAKEQLVDCAGYWVHVDMDVLDPAVMPAVDAPEPGGIAFPELEILLAGLVESPHCLGVEITVFDPDYDPDGAYAEEITSTIVAGLKSAQAADARPDLVAARRDLAAGNLAPGVLAPGPAAAPPIKAVVVPASEVSPAEITSGPEPASGGETASGEETASGGEIGSAAGGDEEGAPEPVEAARSEAATASEDPAGDSGAEASAYPADEAVTGHDDDVVAEIAVIDTVIVEPDEVQSPAPDSGSAPGSGSAPDLGSADDPGPGGDGSSASGAVPAEAGHWPEDEFSGDAPDADLAAFLAADRAADRAFSLAAGPASAEPAAAVTEPAAAVTEPVLVPAGPDPDPAAGPDPDPSAGPDPDPSAGLDLGPVAGDDEADVGQADEAADAEPALDAAGEPDFDPAAGDAEPELGADESEPELGGDGSGPELGGEDEVREPDLAVQEAGPTAPAGTRPLGSAPLLDSKPLPATMPGMLRPRVAEEFTLPAQRPAFEIGPEQPADR